MVAEYYGARSESGDYMEDPSQDGLFMMLGDLNGSDNTRLVVRPDHDGAVWSASVTVLDGGRYEVVRRDTSRDEHEVTTSTSIDDIAYELTLWMGDRDFPALR